MSTYLNESFGAEDYAKYRPTYPKELFDHIVEYHKRNSGNAPLDLIVDLACGTGQATKSLAEYGKRVIGYDQAKGMVEQAAKEVKDSNVEFGVCNDEDVAKKLEPHSVDLLTVAEAAHWFNWPQFWDAAAHVMKPGGTLALFSYWTFSFPEYPEVAKIIEDYAFAEDKCGPYWDEGRNLLNKEYIDIVQSMPSDQFGHTEYRVNNFDKLRPDEPFEQIKVDVPVGAMISLLKTWSPYFNYKRDNPDKPDIADAVMDTISKATNLKPTDKVIVKWKTVYILVTRK